VWAVVVGHQPVVSHQPIAGVAAQNFRDLTPSGGYRTREMRGSSPNHSAISEKMGRRSPSSSGPPPTTLKSTSSEKRKVPLQHLPKQVRPLNVQGRPVHGAALSLQHPAEDVVLLDHPAYRGSARPGPVGAPGCRSTRLPRPNVDVDPEARTESSPGDRVVTARCYGCRLRGRMVGAWET
jgi:hypothetical protein